MCNILSHSRRGKSHNFCPNAILSHQPRKPQQASQSVPNEPEKPPKKSAQTPDNQDLEAVRQEGLNAR